MTYRNFLKGEFNQLKRRVGTEWVRQIPVLLGNPVTGKVFTDDSKSKVFIHKAGETQSFTTAFRGKFRKDELTFGRPMRVKKQPNGKYMLVDVDTPDETYSENVEAVNTRLPVYLSQVMYGTLQPIASSMKALVIGAMYGNNYVPDRETADFSASPLDTSSNPINIPTTNNRAIGVLVQVDSESGTFSYKQSGEFDGIVSLAQAYTAGLLSEPDGDKHRIGYIKLVKGLIQLTYDHLWEVPELISPKTQYFPINLTFSLTIPSNQQLVVSDFTIGTGGVLIINGKLKVV